MQKEIEFSNGLYQYTIHELSDVLYKYVMFLPMEEANMIKHKIKTIKGCKSILSICSTLYTNNDIKLIKDNSSSIDIGIYKFESDSILKDWNKFGQLFIKGSGLVKV